MEKKDKGVKSLNHTGSKGEKFKKGNESDDPQLQEFLQVMQPRVKSKLWANDTLGAPPLEQNGKISDKQVQSKMEGRDESVKVRVHSDESVERENELSDSQMDIKQRNIAHDEVMSDMDYFKSRMKKKWSDSESDNGSESGDDLGSDEDSGSGDDNDGNTNSLNKKSLEREDVQKVGHHEQYNTIKNDVAREKVANEDPFEESDGERMDSGKPSLNSKDGKAALETGRLFVRNLPYTATYSCLLFSFPSFDFFYLGFHCFCVKMLIRVSIEISSFYSN